jgi:hypothetical protein
MTNPSKAKGTAFEVSIVGYLRRWWPNACRTLAGARDDRGDVSGVPIVLELKNEKRTDLAGWWREARCEADNAGMVRAAVVHKRRGVTDPAQQWVSMPLWMLVDLLMDDGVRTEAS